MKTVITLLHPSRGRAKKAKETFEFWKSKASGAPNIIIEHILSIDESDEQKELYYEEFKNVAGSAGIINDNTCVVEATNKAAIQSHGHVLIYLSDDFKCPDNWDILILEQLELGGGIKKPLLLKVNDCLQPYHVKVLTIPIMTRALMNILGYFWHPGYRSMFVDEDLYWTCANNDWLLETAEHLKFPHEHCCNNMAPRDETYIRSEANWDSGKAFFAERKSQNFPV